tara:strand:- start:1025 stop:1228 length:204 start_codon:yes stop_codon:yes gene_type:complete
MSGEQITAKANNSTVKTQSIGFKTSRVNINNLLSKVRKENNKEKKENYIFLGLICAVVAVTGIIASL